MRIITICSDVGGKQQAQWSGYENQTIGVVRDLAIFVNSLKSSDVKPKPETKEQLKLEMDKLLDQLNKFNS